MSDGIRITELDAMRNRQRMNGHAPRPGEIAPLRLIDPRQWSGQTVPTREWIVPELIPSRNVTLLNGDGGLGKTLLMLQLMAAVSTQSRWIGADVEPCAACGMFCEDDEDELHRRWVDVAASLDIDLADFAGIDLITRVGEENALMQFDRATERGTPTKLFHAMAERILDTGARLAVFDSVHDLFPGNENSRPQVRQFVQMFRGLALRMDGAIVLNGHPSQSGLVSGTGTSGSTAWHNAVRSRLYLSRPEATGDDRGDADRDLRVLTSKKSNYGPSGNELLIRWQGGVFVRDMPESSIVKGARADAADAAFLACIDMALAQGRPASDAGNSPRYAPRFFRSLSPARGVREKELKAAMERLFAAGTIVIGKVRGPDRHDVKAIVRGTK